MSFLHNIMTLTITLLLVIIASALIALLVVELRRVLMMLQQNSYRADRYMKWLSASGDTTSSLHLFGLVAFFAPMVPFIPRVAAMALMAAFAATALTALLRRHYKKPLVMTPRATRIFVTATVLAALVAGVTALLTLTTGLNGALYCTCVALTGCFCISHYLIPAANFLLTPVEKSINRKYIGQARQILRSMPQLKIVGITGSYGKTSTKHILCRILSAKYETLMTPGSFNTTLGVVRTVREYLKPYHEVFIVEMGAKSPGDIREICDLVHPQCGIITAVGPQHLESFRTIDAVQATKFELVDSLPSDGVAVVNNDFPKIADRPVDNVRCLRYAVKNTDGADYIATDIKYSSTGSEFTVLTVADGTALRLRTPLVGECNISNILGAVVMARALGVDDNAIAYAVENLEQIEHRLSIRRIPGGLTIIDDAFNSNPVGSAMALDVLAAMGPGKRILITPGMIELGDRQYDLNREFGRRAATAADVVIVVGQYNRHAIADGLADGGAPDEKVLLADSFAEAQRMLGGFAAPGDIVLYENDLPDTFK